MSIITHAAIFFSGFILTFLGTRALLPILRRRAIFDKPNKRSSHTSPTLYGGGLAVIASAGILFLLLDLGPFELIRGDQNYANMTILGAAVLLSVISWVDDLRGISQYTRLTIQLFAVLLSLSVMPDSFLIFQGHLPIYIDRIFTVIIWVWFINLFNFMDGIDGLSVVETFSICAGVFIIFSLAGFEHNGRVYALILAGVATGFVWWNWAPAKVFLGDVGSIPLGFFLGWLLLELAVKGFWLQALILPLYYLVDATWTLLFRVIRREKILESHKEHYYQQAIQKGFSHAKETIIIGLSNILLLSFAVLSMFQPVIGIFGAVAVVLCLVNYLKKTKE